MINPKPLTGGSQYATEYLGMAEYLAEGSHTVGQWHGEGAALLGLKGDIKGEDFRNLLDSVDPRTGEQLRMRGGGERRDENGKIIRHACSGIDCVVSAPKGLSILAMKDPGLKEAFIKAHADTMVEIGSQMVIRDQRNGEENIRSAKPVIAAILHEESRSADCQLHMHTVFHNVAYDPETHTWRGLDTRVLFRERAMFTEIFRAKLERLVVERGYETVPFYDKRGKYAGWEFAAIAEDKTPGLRDKFSDRSVKDRDPGIKAELERRQKLRADHAASGSELPLHEWLPTVGETLIWADLSAQRLSPREEAQIVNNTRSPKKKMSQDDVRKYQLSKLTKEESSYLDQVVADAKNNIAPDVPQRETLTKRDGRYVTAREAIEWGIDHVLERQSVAIDTDIFKAAMQHFGGLDIARARHALATLEEEGEILVGVKDSRGQVELTTAGKIREETQMLALVKAGIGTQSRLGAPRPAPEGKKESKADKESREAINQIVKSRDFVTLFEGQAGTGKTYVAKEVRAIVKENVIFSGGRVFAMAPTGSAVMELQREGFQAKTIAGFLINPPEGKEGPGPGDLILVDEAGMVGSSDTLALLEYAHVQGCRVLLQGDTGQVASISHGDALRTIGETKTHRAKLTEVRRQIPKNYKKAVEMVRKEPEAGLEYLAGSEMNAVVECRSENMAEQLAKKYFERSDAINPRTGKPFSVLVVCATHAMIDATTEAIRNERIRRGEVNAENEVQRYVMESTQMTEAQRRLISGYNDKLVVRFTKIFGDGKTFARGSSAEIVGVDGATGKLRLRNLATGAFAEVLPKEISKLCDVSRVKPIKVSPGDKIMFSANRKFRDQGNRKCVNGEMAVVERVDTETGEIFLRDKRVLDKNFVDFDLAYAVTVYKSQGKTIDWVLGAFDNVSKELFYVAITRARYGLTILTQDIKALAARISVSGQRRSATSMASDYVEHAKRVASENQREVIVKGDAQRAAFEAHAISPTAAPKPKTPRTPPIESLAGKTPRVAPSGIRNLGGK